MEIRKNEPLAPYTTLRVGGAADFFCVAKKVEDIIEATKFAKKEKIPLYVMGGGSNIIIPDDGVRGLVVMSELKGLLMRNLGNYTKELIVSSGENWDDVVSYSVKEGLYGLENLSGIPGTVGAAPIQNIGAYGAEVSEFIKSVRCINLKTNKEEVFSNDECKFGYRESVFKKATGSHLFVTAVVFELESTGRVNIGYSDLKNRFKDSYSSNLTPTDIRDAVIEIRKNKLPDYRLIGSAGSFFKNPVITSKKYDEIKALCIDMPIFESQDQDGEIKIPLAWILDNVLQLKGHIVGGAQIHVKQPLVIVNIGNATSKDIEDLAQFVEKKVMEKFRIKIEREVKNFLSTQKNIL